MLNDNTVNSNYESDADIKEYEVSTQKYEALKNRVIDLLATSYNMTRLAIDTKPQDYRGDWIYALNTWLIDPQKTRLDSRYIDEKPLSCKIETALEALFVTLDKEAETANLEPLFIMTSVSKNEIVGFQMARKSKEFVEITTPPGSGKTFTADYYIAQCRKNESFNCPIWKVTLSETNNNLKQVLFEIANAIHIQSMHYHSSHKRGIDYTSNEYGLSTQIEQMATEKPNGLLIIDEAQNICDHLKGATQKHGLTVINHLRTFTDKKLFGIALLSNGEVFKMAKTNHSTQITRRMEAWRVNAGKPSQEDVEQIISAWQVRGKLEREWSIKIGTGEGGLGSLAAFYRAALQRYGEINIDVLVSFKKV